MDQAKPRLGRGMAGPHPSNKLSAGTAIEREGIDSFGLGGREREGVAGAPCYRGQSLSAPFRHQAFLRTHCRAPSHRIIVPGRAMPALSFDPAVVMPRCGCAEQMTSSEQGAVLYGAGLSLEHTLQPAFDGDLMAMSERERARGCDQLWRGRVRGGVEATPSALTAACPTNSSSWSTVMKEESPIFIVGMPRSGTTLMRASLASHPRIAISPETHFLSYWVPSHATAELQDTLDFERFWAGFIGSPQFGNLELDADAVHDRLLASGVPTFKTLLSILLREHARRCGKPRWGEKTPTHHEHIDQLLEWYPNARIIYMLRDPRAVVASLLDASKTASCLEFHAARWRDSTRVLRRWENDARICAVHYEALVIDPEPALRKVCAFLDEPFDPALLTRSEGSVGTRMNYGKLGRRHLSDALGRIRTDSLTKWQLRLTPDQVAIVEYLTRKGMLRYGYELSSEGPGALLWSVLMFNRLWLRLKRESDRLRGQAAKPASSPPEEGDGGQSIVVSPRTNEDAVDTQRKQLL